MNQRVYTHPDAISLYREKEALRTENERLKADIAALQAESGCTLEDLEAWARSDDPMPTIGRLRTEVADLKAKLEAAEGKHAVVTGHSWALIERAERAEAEAKRWEAVSEHAWSQMNEALNNAMFANLDLVKMEDDRDHYKAKLDALIVIATEIAEDDHLDGYKLQMLRARITEARKPRSEGGG